MWGVRREAFPQTKKPAYAGFFSFGAGVDVLAGERFRTTFCPDQAPAA
ncbi:hypothetical protein HDG37_001292 [Paraburkholderia sp. MM5384-R2]|nr:hypothetical protein [Paraburkholderia sp. MM5384-R2]